MSDFKPCKVQIGEQVGCYHKDTVYLPITPSLLRELTQIYEERAMNAIHYTNQGMERETKEYFQAAFDYWREMRGKYDTMNPEKEEKDA